MSDTDHVVRIEFDTGPNYTMTCTAPADAMCHARYDCECEAWIDADVRDGLPTHRVGDYDMPTRDDEARHVGRFDPGWCNIVEWFEDGDGADDMTGTFTFPVTPVFEGDHYTYVIADPNAQLAAERDRARDLAASLEADLGRVAELHAGDGKDKSTFAWRVDVTPGGGITLGERAWKWCHECRTEWPCPTTLAISSHTETKEAQR